MECALKRNLDYQVVFDALADARGLVKLETLTARWPADANAPRLLPRGCIKQWRKAASNDGYLNWESFSSGLEKALAADATRLSQLKGDLNPSRAEQKLQALRGIDSKLPSSTSRTVQASEVEAFLLSSCSAEKLVQALAKTKREAYKYQQSLSKMALANREKPEPKAGMHGRRHSGNTQRKLSAGSPTTPLPTGALALGHEKEELLLGLEVLERTRQWFSARLEQLKQEEQQLETEGSLQQMKAEELLAVLEQGNQESDCLKHIRKINSHLGSLSMEAAVLPSSPGHYQPPSPSKTMPPPPPSTSRRPGMDHSSAAAAAMAPPVFRYPSDPGPPSSSSSSTGAKRERKLTPHPDYQLPQYARQARPNPASSSGRLSYSTNTMDQVGAMRRPPSRTASLKEQNKPRYAPVTSHSATQGRPPKRSMSLKGSLALSPSVQQHDAQRQYTQPQQYPLRETASLKELPNTQHHTAAAAAATLSSHPASVHSYKQAPATRSVSVRNIPTHTPSHPHPSQQHLLNSFGGYHGDLAASYPPPAKRQGQQRNVPQPVQQQQQQQQPLDQSAKIQELEAQKAALVKQMFQQKAAAQINREDSIVSIVL